MRTTRGGGSLSRTNATAGPSNRTINKRLAYDYEIIHRAHLFNPVFIRDTKICNCGVSVLCTTAEMAMNSIFTACRRLLEMVQVLHLQGYERLRINPGMSPSGCYWRCELLPSKMTVPGNRRISGGYSIQCWNCFVAFGVRERKNSSASIFSESDFRTLCSGSSGYWIKSFPMSSYLRATFSSPRGQRHCRLFPNPRTRLGSKQCFVGRWKNPRDLPFLLGVVNPT